MSLQLCPCCAVVEGWPAGHIFSLAHWHAVAPARAAPATPTSIAASTDCWPAWPCDQPAGGASHQVHENPIKRSLVGQSAVARTSRTAAPSTQATRTHAVPPRRVLPSCRQIQRIRSAATAAAPRNTRCSSCSGACHQPPRATARQPAGPPARPPHTRDATRLTPPH